MSLLLLSKIKSALISFYKKMCVFFNNSYTKVEEIYNRESTKAYKLFAWRICKRVYKVVAWAWGAFAFTFTFLYFTQGLSLLIEGYSGTMNEVFEAKWLIYSIIVGGIFFFTLLITTIIGSIYDFKNVRRNLKVSINKDSNNYVTLSTFNNEIVKVNSRLDRIEKRLGIENGQKQTRQQTPKKRKVRQKNSKE